MKYIYFFNYLFIYFALTPSSFFSASENVFLHAKHELKIKQIL